jgi:hypothetical protein
MESGFSTMSQADYYWEILGIGVAAVVDLVYLDDFPQPDTKMPVRSVQRQGGGLTATALAAATRHSRHPPPGERYRLYQKLFISN